MCLQTLQVKHCCSTIWLHTNWDQISYSLSEMIINMNMPERFYLPLLCFFILLSRISPGVCKWGRNRLQRNKVQNKNRKAVSEMGLELPTQAKVWIHLFSHHPFISFYSFVNICLMLLLQYHTADAPKSRSGVQPLQEPRWGQRGAVVLHHWSWHPLGALQRAQLLS